ncbi:hypothetical protein [Paraburkholderia haematera]|uniref:hypothetical protein n=1 Tax=Paraburkholderia haematera TaxID=2793077 RepID=UPI001F16E939|nr:hypothetical protein [Paraburkholderia haematera]
MLQGGLFGVEGDVTLFFVNPRGRHARYAAGADTHTEPGASGRWQQGRFDPRKTPTPLNEFSNEFSEKHA